MLDFTDLYEIVNTLKNYNFNDKNDFYRFMYNENAGSVTLFVSLFVAFMCWLVSVISGNSSQVDRIWSIVPFVYSWIYTLRSSGTFVNSRLLIMSILSTMWGVRLTYNFYRKGGYNWDDEDYRWPQLRKIIPWPAYQIFNIVFIALYQNILLWLISTPAYLAWKNTAPLNIIDLFACIIFVVLLYFETLTDQQQWEFQCVKHTIRDYKESGQGGKMLTMLEEYASKNDDFKRGFLTTGVFKYSRHLNFFCEQSIWWSFYLFSVAATKQWFNWTVIGAILLTLLFQGSTSYTEHLTLQKYPLYADYQKTTSRLIPWFPGKKLKKV